MANRNIKYEKPETPSFLKKFKEKVRYEEGPDINSKQRRPETREDNGEAEREDEKPTVVVLNEGDLTQEEAEKYGEELRDALDSISSQKNEGEEKTVGDEKISFRKPSKRTETVACLNVSSSKHEDKRKKKKRESQAKGVKNTSLLSFDGDEQEED